MLSVRSGSIRVYLVLALDQYFNVRRLRLRRAGGGGGGGGGGGPGGGGICIYARVYLFIPVSFQVFSCK